MVAAQVGAEFIPITSEPAPGSLIASAPDVLAGDEAGQVRLLLRGGRPAADLVHAEVRVRTVGKPDRARSAAQFLHCDDVRQVTETRAAVFRLDRDAEQPQLAEPGPQVAGKLVVGVDRSGARRDFRGREIAYGLPQQADVIAQTKIEVLHGSTPRPLRGARLGRILSDNPMISQPKSKARVKPRRGAPAPVAAPARRRTAPPAGGPVQFERLSPQPAYRRVSAAIEEKILRRALRPGDSLPTESELARQFGVNRSTVREALRRLESSGLVDRVNGGKRLLVIRPGSAETASRVTRALALDDVTFVELWEAMLAIAPRTAALAAERARAAGADRLDAVVARVDAARTADAIATVVVEFFGLLAELAGNRVLVLSSQPLTRLLAPSLRRMIDRVPQAQSRIVVAERCIVEAVRGGKPDEAENWMTRHIQDFRRGYEIAGMAPDTRVAMPA